MATHFSKVIGTKRRILEGFDALPIEPKTGDFYWDSFNNGLRVFDNNQWYFGQYLTSTSTSTSTTTTSTSTTTTSTSTSSTTSTSTSTSTSTTTTF